MIHPSVLVIERVRQRLRAEGTDPSLDAEVARAVALAEVRRFNDLALTRGEVMIDDEAEFVRDVLASVSGFGALQPLLDDPEIEEIWLNGPDSIHVARGGVSERIDLRLTDSMLRDLVERMLQSTGRRVDISQPFVDASLPDGSRLHVAIADTGGVAYWCVDYWWFAVGEIQGGRLAVQRQRPIWWPAVPESPPAVWVFTFDDFTDDASAEQWGLAAAIFIARTRRFTSAGPTFSELFRHLLPDTDGIPGPLPAGLGFADRRWAINSFRGYVAVEWRRRRLINFDKDVSRSLRAGSEFQVRARRRQMSLDRQK